MKRSMMSCFLVACLIQACQQPASLPPSSPLAVTGPPVTATGQTRSGAVAFTAAVVYDPAGPTWSYTVGSATGAPITAIEIIAPTSLQPCTLTAPVTPVGPESQGGERSAVKWKTTTAPGGAPMGFSDQTGAASAAFSIGCNKKNGPVYLLISDLAGTATTVTNATGQNVIGPIAGPN